MPNREMHERRFLCSPWFPMVAGGVGLVCASLFIFVAEAELLGEIILGLAFPFLFEAGAWEESAAQATLEYDVDWGTVHAEAYSTAGAPARYALGWAMIFPVLLLRETGTLGDGALPIAFIVIAVAAWTVIALLAHRRAVKAWAKCSGLKLRWAKE